MTRSCIECGRPVRPRDRDRCGRCHRRANPTRACRTCGQHRLIVGLGLCDNCWHQDPDLPFRQAARLAARLQDPPEWLDAFVVYAAARNSVGRTSRMISHLGRLLSDTEPNSPQALLQRARRPGRSIGPLARALEDFFVDTHLAFPIDHEGRLAANRRQRRIHETPEPLRPAVARYADALLAGQGRARRAGTRPRGDRTIVDDVAILRDLASFLISERAKTDWASIDVADIEAFLADKPLSRPRRRGVTGQFFRWAKAQRIVLTNPTVGLPSGRIGAFGAGPSACPNSAVCSAAGPPIPTPTPTSASSGCSPCSTSPPPPSYAISRSPTSTRAGEPSNSTADANRCLLNRSAGRRCNAASITARPFTPTTLM